MAKHRRLFIKYPGNKISTDFVFSSLSIESKTKAPNRWKIFKTCYIKIQTTLTSGKGIEKLLKYAWLFSNQGRINFHLQRRSSHSQFGISAKKGYKNK